MVSQSKMGRHGALLRQICWDLNGLRKKLPLPARTGHQHAACNAFTGLSRRQKRRRLCSSRFICKSHKNGTNDDDLVDLASALKRRDMLLILDVVVNHTSDEHEWACKARAGDKKYQDYYYVFKDREIPNMYEESMPEIFPETAPGNFTWNAEMNRYVMTVFNSYQWDLNYSNPAVLIEMINIILFWANRGADILRLDAVAFLWKKLGSTSQNEREAHLLLQLMKTVVR